MLLSATDCPPAGLILALAALLCGCGPAGQDRAFGPIEMSIERERVHRRNASHADPDFDDAIRRVKESLYDEEGQTVEEWLNENLDDETVRTLFRDWKARVIGPQQYRVSFTYTVIDEYQDIHQEGYVWTLNAVLGLVSATREMSDDELAASRSRSSPAARAPHDDYLLDLE